MDPDPPEGRERVSAHWDDVFDALSSEPRRQLILSLMDAPPDRSVRPLREATTPDVPSQPENPRRVMYHLHLPTLADLGFVTWESEPLLVARGPRFDEVAAVLEALQTTATGLPDSLVLGCRRLETARQG